MIKTITLHISKSVEWKTRVQKWFQATAFSMIKAVYYKIVEKVRVLQQLRSHLGKIKLDSLLFTSEYFKQVKYVMIENRTTNLR